MNCELYPMRKGKIRLIPANTPEKIGFKGIKNAIGGYLYTPAGRIRLEQLQPEANRAVVETLCTQTKEMLNLLRDNVSIPLTTIDDVGHWLEHSRIEGTALSLDAFPAIRDHARLARVMHSFFEKQKETSPALWEIALELKPVKELENEINRAVSDQGSLKDNASPELKAIVNRLSSKRNTLRASIQEIFKKATRDGMASDEGPTIRSGRMVIPIQAEYKRKMDGFVHDVSASGQTVYLEPVEALQINNDIRQLEAEERREVERILKSLTAHVRKFRADLHQNSELFGTIDLIHARTRLGLSWDGTIPEISAENEWKIINGKNPNLLLKNRRMKEKDREMVVPLDLNLSKEEQGIIISGPNAGGKSVTLKTIGILALMHQAGVPVPVQADSILPVLSSINLDMGDEQSIENDLSTFSSRLKWMHDTLDEIDSSSLVLIDEAGTGTDPEEGGALFQAYIETVLEKGATVIATTHHGALKIFAHEHPVLANGAMEFNQETLAPTYRFRKGIPGSSYAFEIAGRMKLPASLLDRSRNLLGEHRDRMADLLLSLEQRLQDAGEAHNHYEKLRIEAEKQEKEFREKSRDLDQNRQKKLEEAYKEADRIMKDANRRIEQAVEEITIEGKKNRDRVRKVRREVAEHKKEIKEKLAGSQVAKNEPIENDPPVIGDKVKISGGDTVGELIEKTGDLAVVLAGGLKIKTKFKNLEKTHSKKTADKVKNWKASSYTKNFTSEPAGPSLDLRGMRGDEAIKKLMLYLDNVITGGMNEVDIIHGKGEGILKKLVHEYLDKRQEVKHFELAPWERGGPGCTVVYLK